MFLKLLLPIICIAPARGVVFSFIPGGDAIKNVVTPFLSSFNTTDADGNPTYAANIVRVIDPILAMDFNHDDVVSSPDDYRYFQYPARNYYDSGYADNDQTSPPRYPNNDIFIPRDYPSTDYFYQPNNRLPEGEREPSPWDRIYRPRFNPTYSPNFQQGEYLRDSPQISTTNEEKALSYGPVNFDWAPRPKIPIPTTNINYGIVEPNYGNYPIYSFDNKNPVQNFNHQTNPSFNSIEQPSMPPKRLPVSPFLSGNSGAIVSPFPAKNVPYPIFRPSDLFKPYTEERIKYLKNLVDPPRPAPTDAVAASDFNSDGIRTQWPRDPKESQTSYAILKPINAPYTTEKIDAPSTQQIPKDFNKAKALIMIPLSYRPLYSNEPASRLIDTPKNPNSAPSNKAEELSQNEEKESNPPLEQKGSNFVGPKTTFELPLKAGSLNYDEPIRKPSPSSNVFNVIPLQQMQRLRANNVLTPYSTRPQGSEEKLNEVRPIVMLSPDEPFLKTLASFDWSPFQGVKSDQESSNKSDETSSLPDSPKTDTVTPVVMLSPDGSLLQRLASSNQFNFIPLKQTEKSELNGNNDDKSGTILTQQRSHLFDSTPSQETVKSSQNDWRYLHPALTQQNGQKSDAAKPIVMFMEGAQPRNLKGLDSKAPLSSNYFNMNPLSQSQKIGLNNFWNEGPLIRRNSRKSDEERPIVMLNPDESILNALASSNYFNFLNSQRTSDTGLGDERRFELPLTRQEDQARQNAKLSATLRSPNAYEQFSPLNQQRLPDAQQNTRSWLTLQSPNANEQFSPVKLQRLPNAQQNVNSWPLLQSSIQNEQLFPLNQQRLPDAQQNVRSWPILQSPIQNEQLFPLNQQRLLDAQQNARSFPTLQSSNQNEQLIPFNHQRLLPDAQQNVRSWPNLESSIPSEQFFPLKQQWSRNMPQNDRSWPTSQSQNPSDRLLAASNVFNFYSEQEPRVLELDELMKSNAPLIQQSSRNSDARKPATPNDPSSAKGTYRDWLNALIAKQVAEWDGKQKFGIPLPQSKDQKLNGESPILRVQSPSSRAQIPDDRNLDSLVSANHFNSFPSQQSLESTLNDRWGLDSPLTQRTSQHFDGARPMVIQTPNIRAADAIKPAEPFLKAFASPNYYPHTLQQPKNLNQNHQDKTDHSSNAHTFDEARPIVIAAPSSQFSDPSEQLMNALTRSKYFPLSSQQGEQKFQDPTNGYNLPLAVQSSQDFDETKPMVMLVPNSRSEDSRESLLKAVSPSGYYPQPAQQARLLGQIYGDSYNSPITVQSSQNIDKAKPIVMLTPNASPHNSYEPLLKGILSSKYSQEPSVLDQNYLDRINLPFKDQSDQSMIKASPVVMSLPNSYAVDSDESPLKTIAASNYLHKLGSDLEKSDFSTVSQLYDLETDKPRPILMVPIPALSPDNSILNTITSTKNYNLLPIQLPESFLNNLISSGLFSMLFNDLPGGGGSTDVSRAASPDFVSSPRRSSYTLLNPRKHRVQLYDPTLQGYHGGINPFAHHHSGYGYTRYRFR